MHVPADRDVGGDTNAGAQDASGSDAHPTPQGRGGVDQRRSRVARLIEPLRDPPTDSRRTDPHGVRRALPALRQEVIEGAKPRDRTISQPLQVLLGRRVVHDTRQRPHRGLGPAALSLGVHGFYDIDDLATEATSSHDDDWCIHPDTLPRRTPPDHHPATGAPTHILLAVEAGNENQEPWTASEDSIWLLPSQWPC